MLVRCGFPAATANRTCQKNSFLCEEVFFGYGHLLTKRKKDFFCVRTHCPLQPGYTVSDKRKKDFFWARCGHETASPLQPISSIPMT
jgi:hypothetical protein